MVTKENQGCDEVIEWIDTQDDSIAIRCGDSNGKFCKECKAKNESLRNEQANLETTERLGALKLTSNKRSGSSIDALKQQLAQVEEGCGYSIYIGLENEKCDMQCRKGDLCPACKLKQTYLQKAISALEQKDKEIEEKIKKLKEPYEEIIKNYEYNSLYLVEEAYKELTRITKLFGEGK